MTFAFLGSFFISARSPLRCHSGVIHRTIVIMQVCDKRPTEDLPFAQLDQELIHAIVIGRGHGDLSLEDEIEPVAHVALADDALPIIECLVMSHF